MLKKVVIAVSVILLISCTRTPASTKKDDNINQEQQVITTVTLNKEKGNDAKTFNIESTKIIIDEDVTFIIGDTVTEQIRNNKNLIITNTLFGGEFGPIDGVKQDNYSIGWNDQNRIVYIEIFKSGILTQDGVHVGMKVKDILSLYGEPTEVDTYYIRYLNYDFEVVGMHLTIADDIVTKIFFYTYV